MVQSFIFLVLGFLLFILPCTISSAPCNCSLPTGQPSNFQVINPPLNTPVKSPAGYGYTSASGDSSGYLISIGTTVFLAVTIPSSPGIMKPVAACPAGFTLPDLTQLTLLTTIDFSYLISPDYFHANSSYYYVSSNKVYPNATVPSSNQTYVFSLLQIKSNFSHIINLAINYRNYNYGVFCVLSPDDFPLDTNSSEYDLVLGSPYPYSIISSSIKSNALHYYWQFGSSTSLTDSMQYTPQTLG